MSTQQPLVTESSATPVPELLDVRDVCKLLHMSSRSVYRLADAGKMPFGLKLNGMRRWRRAELEAWIAGGCRPVRRRKGGAG